MRLEEAQGRGAVARRAGMPGWTAVAIELRGEECELWGSKSQLCHLCALSDLRQVTCSLWASIFHTIKWGKGSTYFKGLLQK